MTLKEKLETIKGKKIAIWCEEEWMANRLVNEMNHITSENKPNYYDDYLGETCYAIKYNNLWQFCEKDYYITNGYKIITYKDFVLDCNIIVDVDCKILLTQQDITAILDEKYGKDNWVIE